MSPLVAPDRADVWSIAGDSAAARAAVAAMRRRADTTAQAADDLERAASPKSWRGQAAEHFAAAIRSLPADPRRASGAHRRASRTLETYADTIEAAATKAAHAAQLWQHGDQLTRQALAHHRATMRQVGHRQAAARLLFVNARYPTDTPAEVPFDDPGEPVRGQAQGHLNEAQALATDAAEQAARELEAAAAEAPDAPSSWDSVGGWWSDVCHGSADVGVDVADFILFVGDTYINNPGAMLETAAGVALMLAGNAMTGAGVVVSLSGVGAVVGVPVAAAGVAAISLGGGLTAHGLGQAITGALGDDATQPLTELDRTGNYSNPEFVQTRRWPRSLNGTRIQLKEWSCVGSREEWSNIPTVHWGAWQDGSLIRELGSLRVRNSQ